MAQQGVKFIRVHGRVVPVHASKGRPTVTGRAPDGSKRPRKPGPDRSKFNDASPKVKDANGNTFGYVGGQRSYDRDMRGSKPPAKKAPAGTKDTKLSTKQRVAFGVVAGVAAGLAAYHLRPLAQGASMFFRSSMANHGLKKAGKDLLKRGKVSQAQSLGHAFAHNVRIGQAGKKVMKHPLVVANALVGALWGTNAVLYGRAAIRGKVTQKRTSA